MWRLAVAGEECRKVIHRQLLECCGFVPGSPCEEEGAGYGQKDDDNG